TQLHINDEPIIFSDDAITGEHKMRHGLSRLLDQVRQRNIDLMVIESLDRLSRNMKDTASVFQLAQFHGVVMNTFLEGEINELHIGFKGTMNALFLKTMRHQVKRSHEGQALKGKIFSMPYGYRMKIRDGHEIRGERDIDPDKAAIIRRAFTLFAEGHSLGSMIGIFNAEGIPSPKGKKWSGSSLHISGSGRNYGILNNELYIGRHLWNIKSFRLNPETGKRTSFPNPQSEWVINDKPELRIIDDVLWYRVQKRLLDIKKPGRKPYRKHVKNPCADLVYCGVCSGKKTIANARRFVCSSYRQFRTCDNARGMNIEDILYHVFRVLQVSLDDKSRQEWFGDLQQFFHDEIQRNRQNKAQIDHLTRNIEQLAETLGEDDRPIQEVMHKIRQLDHQRIALRAEECQYPITVQENARSVMLQALEQLRVGLADRQKNDHWRAQLTVLVKKIILHPIMTSRIGETVDVVLHETAWADFYRLLQEHKQSASA
ncbi:MAG: recombinase family protein, partial [Alphaproteobacteria bacterium]|nr:recombinase family protein [Alphaproteobacteria bacterium]